MRSLLQNGYIKHKKRVKHKIIQSGCNGTHTMSIPGYCWSKGAPLYSRRSQLLCLFMCFLRCTSSRCYRLPPCALINLSHGARVDHTGHKLTAIVKPQPATGGNFSSYRQLAGLNHSPRSPFIPTQVGGWNMHTVDSCTNYSPVWNSGNDLEFPQFHLNPSSFSSFTVPTRFYL